MRFFQESEPSGVQFVIAVAPFLSWQQTRGVFLLGRVKVADAPVQKLSVYQIEYFKKIENSWDSILQKLRDLNPKIHFENFEVVNIMIPDQGNEFYEEHAEIVLKKNSFIISVILKDLNVEEIIEI